jgi:hypothetical protein
MADPRFYWYPTEQYTLPWHSSSTSVIKVDIDEPISDIQTVMHRTAHDAITYSMRKHRRHYKPYLEVRVILERFTDDALARELGAMESHLQKGNHVGFTADRNKTWASWAGGPGATSEEEVIAKGDSSFSVNGTALKGGVGYANIFRHWENSGTLATGDIICLDGRIPEFNHEALKVGSSTSLGSTSTTGTVHVDATHTGHVRYPYQMGAVVRYQDFWPYLCLPQSGIGKPIITHDHRISYTFDAVFHYYPGWMSSIQRVRNEDQPLDITTLGPTDQDLGDSEGYGTDTLEMVEPKGVGPGLWDGSWG